MTAERWQQVRKIFDLALDRPPAKREDFLLEACGTDGALRAEVDSLLLSFEEAGDFIETPAAGIAPPESAAENVEGRRLGPYRLVRRIGRGGMGAVYLAVRDDDFHRRVAIKLVKPELETEELLRRFRTERQVLASLDHPNISRLLDGGATDDGSPYLVMEFVEGVSIDRYCDAHRLSITERLRLFRAVCAAVLH
ncbi:MAG: protein kinase domain-containing protein, partial [Bryobacteraceae bacterium]